METEQRAQPVIGINLPCPYLPEIREMHDFRLTRRHGAEKGVGFYGDALRYAQSQWIAGKPAQCILQLDKAWMADVSSEPAVALAYDSPYFALAWMLRKSADGSHGYLGNPVRHFQHLASRMTGPRAGIRSWRAWFCMHLAQRSLVRAGFHGDGRQIAREGLWVPGLERSLGEVAARGWPGEAELAERALR